MSNKLFKPLGYLGRTPLGDLYYCSYSGIVALEKYMQFLGSELPQAPSSVAVHKTLKQDIIKNNRKYSKVAFNDMDANCNTCKYFDRKYADKYNISGLNFIYGDCKSIVGQPDLLPNKSAKYDIMVSASDWYGQPCYQNRDVLPRYIPIFDIRTIL